MNQPATKLDYFFLAATLLGVALAATTLITAGIGIRSKLQAPQPAHGNLKPCRPLSTN